MITRKLTFSSGYPDGRYCRIVEDAEICGYFAKCGSVGDKRLWLQFPTPEEEQAWLEKINTNKLQ